MIHELDLYPTSRQNADMLKVLPKLMVSMSQRLRSRSIDEAIEVVANFTKADEHALEDCLRADGSPVVERKSFLLVPPNLGVHHPQDGRYITVAKYA